MKHFRPFLLAGLILLVSLSCQLSGSNSGGKAPTAAVQSTEGETIATVQPGEMATAAGVQVQNPVEFIETDCACGDLKVSKAFPWGESLECRYDWAGANVDDNLLGFQLSRIYHLDEWNSNFEREKDDLKNEVQYGITQNPEVNVFMEGQYAYGIMRSEPGYAKNDQPVPLCGFGKSTTNYAGDWVILSDLRTCEAPYDMNAYIDQITLVQACAQELVERKLK